LSNEDDNLATVLDPISGEILAEIPVGIEPEGVGITPDGKRVMVTSESTNMVHVISIPEHKPIAHILVGARPREVTFSNDGKWGYVTSEIGGQVSKFDVAASKIVKTVKLTSIKKVKPKGVLLSRDQKTLYVSTGRANSIAVLDATSLELQTTIPVGKRVWGLALSRDGSRLYTCNGVDNTVSVVDTGAHKEIAKIAVGDMPWGVVIDD
jgi:YVTN family beta-propeller protein